MDGAALIYVALFLAAISMTIAFWLGQQLFIQSLGRYRAYLTDETQEDLRDMFVFVDIAKLWPLLICISISGSVMVWFMTSNIVFVLIVGLMILILPRWLIARAIRRRIAKFETQLPDALLALSSSLRSGASLGLALGNLIQDIEAPLSQEFALVLREQRVGIPLMKALNNLYDRMPLEGVRMTTTLMNVASSSGGSLADLLEKLSETLRERLHICMKIDVLTSQGKMQAWVVGALPMLLLAVLSQIDPGSSRLLFETIPGRIVLLIVFLLESCGIFFLSRILKIRP
ncbi:pilus assembly protein [Orrella sp. NBD-18]|uniref:Pilus assembly protein n=1 Tax=Sheuella amnicola TaxID=2707330 RepID=A0A6B2QYN8_9BURK|nr:type II secretion system F family protein [Sheuella amnicola]NDY81847.1 pilus assembly protein [Sheuella amnicola]HBI83425.1 pilus assembly protein [Alcaligenaceae bacterium]